MYKLTRTQDNKIISGEKFSFIEWDEDGRFAKKHNEPEIGRSFILDPHYFKYTWMTTEVIEFHYVNETLHFSTKNSNYILETI